jgi:hypothetical protein
MSDVKADEQDLNRRARSIEHTMNYCRHYNPDTRFGIGGAKKTRLCDAGVSYDNFDNAKAPCIGGHNLPDPLAVCPKWDRKTREEGEKRADDIEASLNRMRIVMPVVAEWRKKPPKGKAEVIECPMCKGRLHLSQAACNGHVHGQCETVGCVSWME